jgi:hypothetical protein
MNPPYSRIISDFLKKARDEALYSGAKTVALIPANVGTKYFHDYCFDYQAVDSIYFIKGRLKYTLNRMPVGSPRFDSCLVVFATAPAGLLTPIKFMTCDRTFHQVKDL